MYLHNILRRSDSELLSQVFKAQLVDVVKGDWVESVQQDLEDFNLSHLNFKSIKSMKKLKFKNIVKKACAKAAFSFLIEESKGKSKLENCNYSDLKMQKYFLIRGFHRRKQRLLFKLRTRMVNVGANYGKSTNCPFGCNSLDDQPHLFQCEFLNEDAQVCNYNDIFSNVPTKFMKITEVALKILRKREKNLTK